MNEKQTNPETVRPTKKQRELLTFIDEFIKEHGYSPSYREIMRGLNYASVATVALHVNSLIKRGHLKKRDHSARSLEVTLSTNEPQVKTNQIAPGEEKWLVEKVEFLFAQAEAGGVVESETIEQLQVLLAALKVLQLDGAAQSFAARLNMLKKRQTSASV